MKNKLSKIVVAGLIAITALGIGIVVEASSYFYYYLSSTVTLSSKKEYIDSDWMDIEEDDATHMLRYNVNNAKKSGYACIMDIEDCFWADEVVIEKYKYYSKGSSGYITGYAYNVEDDDYYCMITISNSHFDSRHNTSIGGCKVTQGYLKVTE